LKIFSVVFLPGMILGLMSPLMAGAAEPNTDATKATIQRVCQACHDLSVLTQAPHTAPEWHAIVARMRANGADLTDAEVKDIGDYLAKAYATQP
jgi:hypothetical protein